MSERKIMLGYFVDVFGPLAAWWVTRWLGIPMFWGLALGIGIAVAAWLSNLPHMAALLILIVAWALFGRWAAPLVDGIQKKLAPQPLTR